MNGVRVLDVDFAFNPMRSEYQIVVSCPKNQEITGQELLDAIADVLLGEGEISPFEPKDPRNYDA